jgi:hypothetical protein
VPLSFFIPRQCASKATMDSATATSPTSSDVMTEWRVGQLVSVEPRTGPGMNQPGGVARITRINADTTCPDRPGAKAPLVQISVKYVVSGNHEKNLESRYVQRHEWEATLRDRTHNSGRCRNCGSLRKDCGFCDELYGVPEDSMLGPSLHQRLPQRRLSSSLPTNMAADLCSSKRQDLSDESNSSEDESVYLKTMIAQNKRNYRKYIKLKARADKFYGKENLGLESPHSKQSTVVQAEARRLGKHQTKLTRNGLVDMRNSETSTSDDENHHYSAATWRAGTNLQSSRRSEQARRHRTRRLNHTKSVLESHVQSDSDSDSDENVALAALKRLDKAAVPNRDLPSSSRSVASSISNPGSAESDSDSISPIPRRSVSAISRNMNGHEITHGPETESDGPEAESDHDGFIQPEGEVDRLPADVFDETLNLEYPALIPFFNKTIERLKKVDIPQAQQQAGELKQEWKDCSDDINPDHRQRQEKREALQRKR